MIPWYWSWILTLLGVTGLYFAGKKQKVGWMIGLCAQVFWIIYAIVSSQYGFVFSAIAYGSVYLRNWIKWSGEFPKEQLVTHATMNETNTSANQDKAVDATGTVGKSIKDDPFQLESYKEK